MVTYRGLMLGAAALTATTFALGATPALASGSTGHPPGNNGTVKIDEYTMDPGHDNDPHVTCSFSVNFFGYDSGAQHATISIRPVAPTRGKGSYSTTTGWDVGRRTSGNQFDKTVPVSFSDLSGALAGVTPQAHQGYHLRLEVEVSGSQGSDDKYKTFWLKPCRGSAPATPTGTSTSSPESTGGSTAPAGPTPTGSTASSSSNRTSTGSTASGSRDTGSLPALFGSASGTQAATADRSAASSADSASAASAVRLPDALVAPTKATEAAGVLVASGSVGGAEISQLPSADRTSALSGAASAGGLAFTGADIAGTAVAGIGLIGLGGALTIRSRRRH